MTNSAGTTYLVSSPVSTLPRDSSGFFNRVSRHIEVTGSCLKEKSISGLNGTEVHAFLILWHCESLYLLRTTWRTVVMLVQQLALAFKPLLSLPSQTLYHTKLILFTLKYLATSPYIT